jgi:hypoxanthine phosphoribosyltransferase
VDRPPAHAVRFAHVSERQFALLLDFYAIAWEYEAHTFPIGWDRDGVAAQYFTPDFYLPDEGLFIEITTMNQKLVTKKNAKVRRLRELHPEIRCKVLYQRDYLHLVVKYGLEEPEHLGATVPTRMPGPPQVTRLGERGVAFPAG